MRNNPTYSMETFSKVSIELHSEKDIKMLVKFLKHSIMNDTDLTLKSMYDEIFSIIEFLENQLKDDENI